MFFNSFYSRYSEGNTKTAEEMDTALAKAFKEIVATSNEPAKAEKITKDISEKSGEVTTALQVYQWFHFCLNNEFSVT